jgi:hypothetical protein
LLRIYEKKSNPKIIFFLAARSYLYDKEKYVFGAQ